MPTQGTFYLLSKIMHHLIEGLHVDRQGLQQIKRLTQDNRKMRIVFLPIYKSYSDPLILHYINYYHDLELGFTFGNYEDSPKIGFVERLLKRIGAILIRRDPMNSVSNVQSYSQQDADVMNYVNQSLFQEVLEHNVITTLFQNDERLRSGKYNLPLSPENSVRMLLKSIKNLQRLKYNVQLVPVCVNYDRLFDSSYLSTEMISGEFQNTTLFDLLKKIFSMREGKMGKVFVKYAEPIDLQSYMQQHASDSFDEMSLRLTRDLYQIQQKEQPITMNSLISTSLLFNQEEEMSFQAIKVSTKLLYDYILEKGYMNYISASPQFYDINQASLSLGF